MTNTICKGGLFVGKKTIQEWKGLVQPALSSKQGEFKLIGYAEVSKEEIWRCLEEKIWKGNPKKLLHEVVEDIFHLSPTTYMSFITVNALKVEDEDIMSSIQALTKKEDA